MIKSLRFVRKAYKAGVLIKPYPLRNFCNQKNSSDNDTGSITTNPTDIKENLSTIDIQQQQDEPKTELEEELRKRQEEIEKKVETMITNNQANLKQEDESIDTNESEPKTDFEEELKKSQENIQKTLQNMIKEDYGSKSTDPNQENATDDNEVDERLKSYIEKRQEEIERQADVIMNEVDEPKSGFAEELRKSQEEIQKTLENMIDKNTEGLGSTTTEENIPDEKIVSVEQEPKSNFEEELRKNQEEIQKTVESLIDKKTDETTKEESAKVEEQVKVEKIDDKKEGKPESELEEEIRKRQEDFENKDMRFRNLCGFMVFVISTLGLNKVLTSNWEDDAEKIIEEMQLDPIEKQDVVNIENQLKKDETEIETETPTPITKSDNGKNELDQQATKPENSDTKVVIDKKASTFQKLQKSYEDQTFVGVKNYELLNPNQQSDADSVIFQVPGRMDEQLTKSIMDSMRNMKSLYDGYVQQKTSTEVTKETSKKRELSLKYIELKSLNDQKKISEYVKIDLSVEQDIPIILVKNRYQKDYSIITLKDFFLEKEKVYQQFKPLKKIAETNFDRFTSFQGGLADDQYVLLQYLAKDDLDNYKSKKGDFYLENVKNSNQNLQMVMINDKSQISKLVDDYGVQNSEISPKLDQENLNNGEYLLIYRNSFLNGYDNPVFQIQSKNSDKKNGFSILRSGSDETDQKNSEKIMGKKLYDSIGFVNSKFPIDQGHYTLQLNYDKNKISKQDQRQLYQLFKTIRYSVSEDRPDLFEKFQFYVVPKNFHNSEAKIFQILVRDNVKTDAVFEYLTDNETKDRQAELENGNKFQLDTKGNTFQYVFPDNKEFISENLIEFMDGIVAESVEQTYKSQMAPKKKHFCRKIVGKNFEKKVINNKKDQVQFCYSRACHGCERFGPIYEKIAQDYYVKGEDSDIKFNRMDNDNNNLPGYKNFDSTPIFAYYKSGIGIKSKPYLYSNNKLNESMLQSWINITKTFHVINDTSFMSKLIPNQNIFKLKFGEEKLEEIDVNKFEFSYK